MEDDFLLQLKEQLRLAELRVERTQENLSTGDQDKGFDRQFQRAQAGLVIAQRDLQKAQEKQALEIQQPSDIQSQSTNTISPVIPLVIIGGLIAFG